jgi:hypothetical protein
MTMTCCESGLSLGFMMQLALYSAYREQVLLLRGSQCDYCNIGRFDALIGLTIAAT